eukprot:CAMPEP_0113511310 /NCGR_PEP_ID=MMETSP0014_2-20120614/38640_1 /TAXON_ID=2857 /ORGANISM="Nitzschia sp." /LENGTH=64 /DNA_ID=CAMNT_0000407397 /DNA_START=602 /DNA_END=796 /DNA_ORIENTATION=- /assembly_acc=CAM_ASM_000159
MTDSDSSWASEEGGALPVSKPEATSAKTGPAKKKVPVGIKGPTNQNMTAAAANKKEPVVKHGEV